MSMRSWIRKLFIRPFGRAAPQGRRYLRLTVEIMEDRIAPANVFDHGTATLSIVLGTNENLVIVSSGMSYGLTTNLTFTNGGVSKASDFSPFGSANLKLNPSGISRYTTAIEITDSGAGDSVTFSDSGGSTYANNITVVLANAGAGAITFQGASTFAGNDALSASTTMNLVVSAGATVSTSGGNISLASTGSNTTLTVNGAVTSVAGDVNLQATGDVTLNAPVTTSGGAVTLNADSDADGIGTLTLSAAVMAGLAQQAELNSSDGAANDGFGTSVALSGAGATAVVGAPFHQVGANTAQGAAYVFTLSGASWTEQAELTASDGAAFDNFGIAVALSADGNTALIGADSHQVGPNRFQGAAYVFTFSGTTWTQENELTADDGAAADAFGCAVSLSADGNTALVGALNHEVGSNAEQGAAYVFTFSGTIWTQQAELTANDGVAYDNFGNSVALSGDGSTALVGAYFHQVGANSFQGAAYVFALSGSNWSLQAELTASDGGSGDVFGSAVALSDDGDTALIGAPSHTVGANDSQGAAYVFALAGTTWTQQQELTASDGMEDDLFGSSVALSTDGNTALVGNFPDGSESESSDEPGAAYVYAWSGGNWTQQQELTANDGTATDGFAYAAALSGDASTALIGAPDRTVGTNDSEGSAYVFLNDPGSAGGSIDAGAGPVTATAAAMNFQGPIASSNTVSIAPSQTGATIDLGGGTTSLQLTNADLAEISAGVLQIGDSSTGNIQVSANILAPAGWDTLDLVTGASVIQSAAGSGFTVANLDITAPVGIGASGQPLTLDVTTLTADSSGDDSDQFLNEIGTAQLTSTGALNAGSGTIELDGGTFQLTADNAVASADNLSVQTGAIFDINGNVDTVNTVQLAGGTISDTLGGGVLTSTTTIDVESGTASAILAGSNGLSKTTDGTVTLSGTNTYTGATTISGGTLSISSDANLGTPPTTATAGNIVLNGGTLQATGTFTLSSNRGIALGSSAGGIVGVIDVVAGDTLTYGGILADNGVGAGGILLKTGSGILVLAGDNTYTGATLINGGTLQIGAGGATGSLGAGTVADNAALAFDLSSDVTIPNFISGVGSLTQSGTGTTTLTNTNSYNGVTAVTAGTLADGADNALPTGTQLLLTSPGAFDLAGFNQTIGSFNGSPGSTLHAEIDSAAAYDQLTVTGPTNLSGATLSLVGMIASVVGQVITLIDSTLAINGIFNTLPQDATVTVNGLSFVLSYTGDNVTLTQSAGVAPTVSVNDGGGIYTGAPFPATATVNGGATLEGVGLTLDYVNTATNQDLGATAPSAAGSYQVTASFAGSADYLPGSNSATFTIGDATPTVSVSDAGGTYDGSTAFAATASVNGAATLEGVGLTLDYVNTASKQDLGVTAPIAAGSYEVTASFAGSADYLPASNSATFTIGDATPTISISDNGGTYDGATAFPANATVNGGATLEGVGLTLDYVNTATNQDLGATAPIAAGSYQVTASFAGSADYLPASNSATFTIGDATPTVSVSDAGGTYDGSTAFAATASVNGTATLEGVGLTLDYVNTASKQDLGVTAPSAAGSYEVTASFAGSADYLPGSNSATFTIGDATPTISISDNGGTYDGATAFPANASVNGAVTLEGVGVTLDYVNTASKQDLGATAPIAAGSYEVTASFAGSADYLPASNSATFTIGDATPTISISDNGGTYDGVTAFAANASVNGAVTLEGVGVTLDYVNTASKQDLGATAPIAAGSYQVTASFAGSADYLPASNSATFTIGMATPTVSISDNGGTYDGATAFPANASVNGAATLEGVGVTLDYVNTASKQDLGATAPIAAGSYQVTASFAGSADYLPGSNSATFTIGDATPTISISDNGGTYDGATAFPANASVNGAATLEGVGVTLDYVNTASKQDLGATAPIAAGSYEVTASFAGSADYLPASNSATFTIGMATPTVSISDNGGTYDGATAFAANASVNGAVTLEGVGVTLDYVNTASKQDMGATAPIAAGSYQVTASFAGSADYLPASNSATFSIGDATPTISVSDAGGTYDGTTAFPATASVNGAVTLEGVGVTLDYVNTASKQDVRATAPVAAGSYEVTATFAGSADYLPASNSATFTIGMATPTVSISDNGGTYDGVTAFAANASVNGAVTLEGVGVTLDYVNTASKQDLGATAPSAAGSYEVTATFAGSADYLPASNSTTFTIGMATPTVSISDNGGTYDGATAFPATANVNGAATLEGVGLILDYVNTVSKQDLGASAPIAAGSYEVTASFAGSADYLPASNSTTFTIGDATPTVGVSTTAPSPVALLAGSAPSDSGVPVAVPVAPTAVYLSGTVAEREHLRVAFGIPQRMGGGEPTGRAELTDVVRRDVFGVREFTDANVLPAAMWSEPSSWNLARAAQVPLSLANASLEGDDSVFLVEMLRQRARSALESSDDVQEIRASARGQDVITDPTPADDAVSRPVLLTGIVAIPVTAAFVWVAWRYWDRGPALRRRLGLPDVADLVKLESPPDTGK